jgi:hypothetical protein
MLQEQPQLIEPRKQIPAHRRRRRGDQHSIAVQAFFIRELRVIGGPEDVPALGRHLLDDALYGDTVQALLTIREGAAAQFRRVLDQAKGPNRMAIIEALGVLQDAESAGALRPALSDADPDIRRAAGWALANLGDGQASEALLKAADRAEGWERIEATRHCMLLAERLAATGRTPQARQIYARVRDTRKDPGESHVHDAADQALNALPR